jgi:multiple sugar transport system ATP-binding protein
LRLAGTVVVSERLGAERSVYVQTGAGVFAVRVDADVRVTKGETVTLTAPPPALAFFTAEGRLLNSLRDR